MNAEAVLQALSDKVPIPLPPGLHAGEVQRHAAGRTLAVGESGGGVLIASGLVCAFTSSHRQRAIPLCLLGAGDLLGEVSPLRAVGRGLRLQAVTEVHCLPLRAPGPATSVVFQALCQRTAHKLAAQADWRIAGTAFERVAQTLRLLAMWALNATSRDWRPPEAVGLALGTTALAGLCGLSRRHTAEALLPLQVAGWLRAQRNGLLLRWPWVWQSLGGAPRLCTASDLLAVLEANLSATQGRGNPIA